MHMYICAWVYDVHLTGHCFQGLRTAAQHGPYSRGCIVSENCLVAQQVCSRTSIRHPCLLDRPAPRGRHALYPVPAPRPEAGASGSARGRDGS
jgi:hypothetical protein